MSLHPRYPIYIPSKGRAANFLTAKMFDRDAVRYHVVIEPSQVEKYQAWKDKLIVLPENDRGLVYARNWIKDHATAAGHERHWQFDDDVRSMTRVYRGNRLYVASNIALSIAEDFVDRYENVGLASFNSEFFVPSTYGKTRNTRTPPFYLNARCYTNFLVWNTTKNRWRRRYNEDTDMTLQILSCGLCTVLFNAFLILTPETMAAKGGQTDIYVNDGRMRMARQLESMWPGTVSVIRRHGRPQHYIKDDWSRFTTKLKLKPGVVISKDINEYGMMLKELAPVQHPELKKLLKETQS